MRTDFLCPGQTCGRDCEAASGGHQLSGEPVVKLDGQWAGVGIEVHGLGMSSHNRRKFRSQTSDNVDRWKSTARKNLRLRQGEGPKREERRWRRSEREKVRREQMQVLEKVRKSRNTVFFQCPEGRQVGSPKRRVRSQQAR